VIEWLFLLLPVAAASGWWAARRGARGAPRVAAVPDPAYFRGINYLLDDQPDKAIDLFLRLSELDGEAAEIQLALGGLFRRRGEVDRAIRVHQGLVGRPDLDDQVRAFALYELGQDYMRAGLFDRAERLFDELVESRIHRRRALEALLEIYQQEKEWGRCMKVAVRLQDLTGRPMREEIAHYHCELAEEALRRGDAGTAEACLRDALSVDASCARAVLLQAGMAMERGERDRAGALYLGVAARDPGMVPEVLPGLSEAYRHRPEGDLRDQLSRLHGQHPGPELLLALADAHARTQGPGAAIELLVTYLKGHADLAALERLLALHESRSAPSAGASREVCRAVRRVVQHLCSRRPKYRCEHCGFVARQLHWQCPSCKHWSSIRAVQPQPLDDDGQDPSRPSAGLRAEPLNRVVDVNAGACQARARR
jgi:lipopolysaccharide biosynthesis regulator YciM